MHGICVDELLVCVRMHLYAYVFVSACCIHVMCMSVLYVRMLVLCVFNSASPVVTIPCTLFYKKYKVQTLPYRGIWLNGGYYVQ